jgi:hypothetical protein
VLLEDENGMVRCARCREWEPLSSMGRVTQIRGDGLTSFYMHHDDCPGLLSPPPPSERAPVPSFSGGEKRA